MAFLEKVLAKPASFLFLLFFLLSRRLNLLMPDKADFATDNMHVLGVEDCR